MTRPMLVLVFATMFFRLRPLLPGKSFAFCWLCLMLCCLPGSFALARGADALEVGGLGSQAVSLTEHFAVLEDTSGSLMLEDVTSVQGAADFASGQPPAWSLKFGLTRSAYWLRLTLKNSGSTPFDGMLEFTYPRLASSVQMYVPTGDGRFSVVNTGYAQPFESRPYPHRFYVLPVSVPAQTERTVYFRFQSDINLEIPARLWQRDAFHRYERVDYVSQALYFGMVFSMMGFNLLLFVALRSVRYLLYVGFGVSSAMSVAAINGLAIEYLWGSSPYWINISGSVGYAVSLAVGIVFMRSMVDTKRLVPRLDVALKLAAGLQLALAAGLALAYTSFIKPQLALSGAAAVFVMLIGVWCAIRRDRSALYFSVAFAVMAAGSAANSLRALGLVPTTVFSTDGIQIGSAIEMVLLAFALADRYNVIRREKESAQGQALVAQQALVASLQSSERELERRVSERTEELRQANLKLASLSETDSLTGLANRRRFDDVLATEWRRAQRTRQPLAVGLLDVDWFKKYNDHYGHLAGDDCLKQVAAVLTQTIGRTGDLVARYGGEEFVFIAPGLDGEQARILAEKVCQTLAAFACPHVGSAFGHVTASVGVASVVPSDETSPRALIKRSDDALYQAKASGRNQAVLAAD